MLFTLPERSASTARFSLEGSAFLSNPVDLGLCRVPCESGPVTAALKAPANPLDLGF